MEDGCSIWGNGVIFCTDYILGVFWQVSTLAWEEGLRILAIGQENGRIDCISIPIDGFKEYADVALEIKPLSEILTHIRRYHLVLCDNETRGRSHGNCDG